MSLFIVDVILGHLRREFPQHRPEWRCGRDTVKTLQAGPGLIVSATACFVLQRERERHAKLLDYGNNVGQLAS